MSFFRLENEFIYKSLGMGFAHAFLLLGMGFAHAFLLLGLGCAHAFLLTGNEVKLEWDTEI